MHHDNFVRTGTVSRIIDGDSLHALLDLGFRVWHKTHIRLVGIDAPERGEPGWYEARMQLERIIPPDAPITVESIGPDKYGGRWLCHVRTWAGVDVGQAMVASGHASAYDGGKRGVGEQ